MHLCAWVHVCAQHVCSSHGVRKRSSDLTELEVHVVVSFHVGSGNWTGIFSKSSRCSYLLSCLSSSGTMPFCIRDSDIYWNCLLGILTQLFWSWRMLGALSLSICYSIWCMICNILIDFSSFCSLVWYEHSPFLLEIGMHFKTSYMLTFRDLCVYVVHKNVVIFSLVLGTIFRALHFPGRHPEHWAKSVNS